MMHSETGIFRKNIIQIAAVFLLLLNSTFSTAQDHLRADSLIEKWEMHLQDSSALVQSKALIEIGRSLRFQHPDSARYYFIKSLALAQKSRLPKQIAKATSAIGGVHYVKGEYDFAMENFTKALNIYDSLNDKKGIASGLNNMGLIQNMQDHYDDAILNHQKSIKLCHETGDFALLAINLLNLGICYHTMGDQDKTIDYFNRSETINKKLNSKRGVTQINNLKGQAYLKKGEFYKARVLFERILKQGREVNQWELALRPLRHG